MTLSFFFSAKITCTTVGSLLREVALLVTSPVTKLGWAMRTRSVSSPTTFTFSSFLCCQLASLSQTFIMHHLFFCVSGNKKKEGKTKTKPKSCWIELQKMFRVGGVEVTKLILQLHRGVEVVKFDLTFVERKLRNPILALPYVVGSNS